MTWDFAERNPFSESSGNFADTLGDIVVQDVDSVLATKAAEVHCSTTDTQTIYESENSYPPIRHITTILDMPTCQISSMFGCGGRFAAVYPNLLGDNFGAQRRKNWSPRHTATAANRKRRHFFLDGMTQAMRNLALAGSPGCPYDHLLRLQTIRDGKRRDQ